MPEMVAMPLRAVESSCTEAKAATERVSLLEKCPDETTFVTNQLPEQPSLLAGWESLPSRVTGGGTRCQWRVVLYRSMPADELSLGN